MPRDIYIIRHGHREDFIGNTEQLDPQWKKLSKHPFDPALSELGKTQAQALARTLAKSNLSHIFASPFRRAIETASYLAYATGLTIKIEPGLGEWLNPDWFPDEIKFLSINELSRLFPGAIDAFYFPKSSLRYPEPDEFIHLRPRVANTLHTLLNSTQGNIALIGHGASVRAAALCLAMEPLDIETALCGIIHFRKKQNSWALLKNGRTKIKNGAL